MTNGRRAPDMPHMTDGKIPQKRYHVESNLSVCLLGFNVAFKHLRSYRDGACFVAVVL